MDQPTVSHTPYPGLRSFLRSEFDIFYGRDDHVSDMLDKLAENQFLCVTGPSGCGKSSLARTGLFNALEAGFLEGRGSDWIYCDLYPETDPLDRLASSLAQAVVTGESGRGAPEPDAEQTPVIEELRNLFLNQVRRRSSNLNEALDGITLLEGRPIVILVDQFEEIFRYAQDDPHEASRFVDVLLKTTAARRDVYVVITIRTDELEKCSRYSGLTSAINHSQFLTPTLDRFQMQEAIEGPISLFGGTIEPELSIWLLNGLEEQLDKLPLMQHALRLLYIDARLRQPEGPISIGLPDFFRAFDITEDINQARGAGHDALRTSLSHRLDKLYNKLNPRDQEIARGLFCALTTLNSRGRDIRRPIKLGAATETLNCDFKQLVSVISVFKDGAESYLRIVGEHDGLDPDDTVDVTHECVLRLWQPLRDTWLPEESNSASTIRFLARLAHDREQTAKNGFWERVLGTGLLRKSARKRHSEWWAAQKPNAAWASRHLGNLTWKDGDRQLNPREIFDRVAAYVDDSKRHARAENSVYASVAGLVVVTGIYVAVTLTQAQLAAAEATSLAAEQREELALLRAQEAEKLAKEEQDKAWETRQVAARQALSAIQPTTYAQNPYEIAARSEEALVSAIEVDLDQSSLENGLEKLRQSLDYIHELRRFEHGSSPDSAVYAASFYGDGEQIVTLSQGLDLTIWNRSDNAAPARVIPLEGFLSRTDGAKGRSMAVSPDGSIAVGTQRGGVLLIAAPDSADAAIMVTELYAGPTEWKLATMSKLAFSPDGRYLMAGSLTGHIHFWRKQPSGAWGNHGIYSSRSLSDHSGDGAVDLANGQEYSPPSTRIWSVAFSPDSSFAAFARQDGTICLMTPDATQITCSEDGHTDPVKGLAFSPDGTKLASGGNDDSVRIWHLEQIIVDRSSPDGETVLPYLTLSPLALWQESDVWDVAFNRDGDLLAVTSWDGSTYLYKTDRWRPIKVLRGHQQSPRTVAFASDSNEILTSALDKTARLWTPFASRLSDYALSVKLLNDAAKVDSVALGPSGDWLGYTDRTSVWIKGRDRDPSRVYTNGNTRSDPQNLATSLASDIMIASLHDPAVIVFRKSGPDMWAEREIPLTGEAIAFQMRGRRIALSDDGERFAVHGSGPDGSWILICATAAETCGTAQAEHIAKVRFQAEIATSRPAGHGCRRPAFPTALALSPSGDRLAVGGSDCNIRIYDMAEKATAGTPDHVSEDHVGNITALDFAYDGSFLVAGSADWQGSIWWPESGNRVVLKEHRSSLNDARALPSGQFVATVSNDEHLIIWDTDSGKALADYQSFTSTLNALDVQGSDHGVKLAVGTNGGDVVVQQYFETPGEALGFARATLNAIAGPDG